MNYELFLMARNELGSYCVRKVLTVYKMKCKKILIYR